MDKMEIFYAILGVIFFGTIMICTYLKHRKGKVEMLQRRQDEIRSKEEFRKKVPVDLYEEIYGDKKEK